MAALTPRGISFGRLEGNALRRAGLMGHDAAMAQQQHGAELTAASFLDRLTELADPAQVAQFARYFKTGSGEYGEGDTFIGVRMGTVFDLARASIGMPVGELEKLLESEIHEARAGALTIMNEEAKKKRTPDARRTDLFDLYLRRHDRINNWDLVDVACRYVIGAYVFEKPRDVLYELAKSPNLWQRRTAIVSTWYFIRAGQTDDAIAISELLLDDREDLIHKATGWMLRYLGDVDRARLIAFLDEHASTMPRTALRYSIEKFSPEERAHYLGLGRAKG
ncbi:MAG: alkylation repair protein [Rhodoglobus sp.]|nr:alkylation repair protein [Rhodoglobus sp.]